MVVVEALSPERNLGNAVRARHQSFWSETLIISRVIKGYGGLAEGALAVDGCNAWDN
jgi:hypothetical protein